MEVLPAEKRMLNARLFDGQNKQFALTHGSRQDVFCEILDGKLFCRSRVRTVCAFRAWQRKEEPNIVPSTEL